MVVPVLAAASITSADGGRWANFMASTGPMAWTAAWLRACRSTSGVLVSVATLRTASAQGPRSSCNLPPLNWRRVRGVTRTGLPPAALTSST